MHNMPMLVYAIVLLAITLLLYKLWSGWRRHARAEYIRTYPLPPGLYAKLQKNGRN